MKHWVVLAHTNKASARPEYRVNSWVKKNSTLTFRLFFAEERVYDFCRFSPKGFPALQPRLVLIRKLPDPDLVNIHCKKKLRRTSSSFFNFEFLFDCLEILPPLANLTPVASNSVDAFFASIGRT